MTTTDITRATEDFEASRDSFRSSAAVVIEPFMTMKAAATAPGALDRQSKALIQVLLAVARQSERCILTHTESAVTDGVTRDQLVEGLGLTVVFGGAPAFGFSSLALDVFDNAAAKVDAA